MIFGLSSGSTVKHTVDRLGELLQPGKVHNIIEISKNTHQQVISLRISLSNLDPRSRYRRCRRGGSPPQPSQRPLRVRNSCWVQEHERIKDC
ncbi:putative ribose-5-phosphate isomerase [Rosa chinensis]|uniref:Putative ribose-5-phosphate isomerase n=1 Tax=Rosa chinensis TaxID=74649 RepID=A0A2P6P6S8_ROSCH|nr:putative ribose-5-phosphate isomerase [Rosa chinensis]